MKVLKSFTCRLTRRRYEAGSTYDGKRGVELAAKGVIEAPKEKAEIQPVKEKKEISKPKKNERQ